MLLILSTKNDSSHCYFYVLFLWIIFHFNFFAYFIYQFIFKVLILLILSLINWIKVLLFNVKMLIVKKATSFTRKQVILKFYFLFFYFCWFHPLKKKNLQGNTIHHIAVFMYCFELWILLWWHPPPPPQYELNSNVIDLQGWIILEVVWTTWIVSALLEWEEWMVNVYSFFFFC